jgi:hypothetical protein
MKLVKKILGTLLIIFIISQLFGPERNEGDITTIESFLAETDPPEDVKLMLKNTCFDCHSDVTRYPWYSWITPLDYWMAHHVKDGKKHFNVSSWSEASLKKRDHKFEELIEMVKKEEMPLPSYTWTHGDARLSADQISSMVSWAEDVRSEYAKQKPTE